MEMSKELQRANEYWEEREQEVWGVAYENGLGEALECLMETTDFDMSNFLFDLFDYGDADLETVDILEGLKEALGEEQ